MSMSHEDLRYAHEEGHTDVCYSEDGKKCVTCGADGDVRIWSMEGNEDPTHTCIGEWALSVRQKGNKLYVATGSNDIQILTLPDGDRDGVFERFTAPINHIAIAKDSKMIALAAEDMELRLIKLENDAKDVQTFSDMTGPCLSTAICPNSRFIACSAGDGKLRVWDIETSNLCREFECFPKVNSFANAKILCRMDFHPIKGHVLAYPDSNTVVLLDTKDWSQIATLNCDEVNSDYSIVQYSPCGKFILATSEEGDFVLFEVNTENVVNISKHPKSIAVCGLMWNPLGNGQVVYTDVEGQLGILHDCIEQAKDDADEQVEDDNVGNENDVDFGDMQFEDDDEDNENAISVEKLKKQYMGDIDSEFKDPEVASSRAPTPRPRTPEIPLQAPFMPSSTPEHLDPRYLCWNEVGIIKSYGLNAEDEAASKSIEVEFHDMTFHNSMMMQNYQEYSMASVSKGALAVANSTQINVIPLSAPSKEWMLKVEEYEEIVAIATSENLICFAMANYLIRICSIFGTQRAVISIPGPVVCMSAYKNLLMVAYHAAGVRKSDQSINIKIIKVEGVNVESKDLGSAMGPESTLYWLGFSDMGTPAMMDSLGMLCMFPSNCNIWIPYCDTTRHRKSPADGFFITAVNESYQAIAGIKCKGTVYPGFTPRPTMCELPLEPPYAESATEKTQMEANLFMWSSLQVADCEKKFKESAVKTFALACRNSLDERALEFMEIVDNPQILALCIKYATKLEKRRLAEKLMQLASRLSNDIDEDYITNNVSTPDLSTLKPSVSRKLKLSTSKTPRNRLQKSEVATPVHETTTAEVLTPNTTVDNTPNETVIDTQQSVFQAEDEPKNPFLKCLKKPKVAAQNPLSLTDKFAGVNYEKENKKVSESGEKRKLSDSDNEKQQKEKQRKLDMFKFTKRS